MFGAGWLSDRIAVRDARSYGIIPGLSLMLATPIYILAVTRESAFAAIRLLAVAATVQYTYLAPVAGRVPEPDASAHARHLDRDRADSIR